VDVERPLFARVSGFDIRGEPLEIEASGLEARVLQHEIDHLDGVLMLDRAPRDQRKEGMRALRAALEAEDADDAAFLRDEVGSDLVGMLGRSAHVRAGDRGAALRLYRDNLELLETRFRDDYTDPDPMLSETLFLFSELARANGEDARADSLARQAESWGWQLASSAAQDAAHASR
jgi:hypothetical protein